MAGSGGTLRAVLRTLLAASLLAVALPVAARDKTDVVILRNGDHITGEVKGMARGKLDFSTNDVGRISIEWDKVVRLTSRHQFEVELGTGERLFGPIETPADGELAVGEPPMPDVVAMSSVVEVVPMDDAFANRLRAILDLGFTFAKANLATTLSTSGEFSYRAEDLGAKLTFDGYFQDDDTKVAVSRYSAGLQGDWFFRDRWRAILAGSVDHNDEMQLTLRVSLAPAVSWAAVRNGWTELRVTGGLAGSRELYVGTDPTLTLDALLGVTWEAFRYDTPKLDLTVSLALLPGLSDPGRLRGTATVKGRYEVFKDFNVGIAFNDTFDTRPPDPSAPNNDYILTFTVGWSYRR